MIWEVASKICWLAASVETPGVILNTYHDYEELCRVICTEFSKDPSSCGALY